MHEGLLLACGAAVCYKRHHTIEKLKTRHCQLFQENIICLKIILMITKEEEYLLIILI